MSDSAARHEAQRLVATALALAATAAQSLGGAADGACRACPLCRAARALRDPSPEFAQRLAAGAGDFAAGLVSLLRSLDPDPADAAAPTVTPAEAAS